LRNVYNLKTRIVKRIKKKIKEGAAGELNEGKKNINNGESGNTGKNKNDDIKKKIRENISEKTGRKLLFKKKKDLLYYYF